MNLKSKILCFRSTLYALRSMLPRFTLHAPRSTKTESGIATIMAIGVASLLLMLGVAFVTTSMIERKASVNYQSMNQARALAQTAFNRAMANMKLKSYNPNESMNEIVSHDNAIPKTSASNNDMTLRKRYADDLATEISTTTNEKAYFEVPSDYVSDVRYDITDTSSLTWIYLKNDLNESTDSQIIGRIAYVVLPDKGKIDPWAVIDSGYNAYVNGNKKPPSESSYGGGISSIAPNGTPVYGRPGRDITELCLASLEYDTDSFPPASLYPQKMSVKTCATPGLVDTGTAGEWRDLQQIFSSQYLNIPSTDTAKRQYFQEVFYVNSPADDEKYWVDGNLDSRRDPGEMQTRFNLARTDWDTLSINPTSDTLRVNAIGNNPSDGLQWLVNWKSLCGMGDQYNAKSQIIANLIDYCDTDTKSTYDSSTDTPRYTGNERCPYINQVNLRVTANITYTYDDVANPKTRKVKLNSIITNAGVEVVDMYGVTGINTKALVNCQLAFYWKITTPSVPDQFIRSQSIAPVTLQIPAPTALNRYRCFPTTWPPVTGTTITFPAPLPDSPLVANSVVDLGVQIKELTVKLTNDGTDVGTPDGTFYDYSYVRENNSDTSYYGYNKKADTNSLTSTKDLDFFYEVSDPRQNINASDWVKVATNTWSNTSTPNNSIYPTVFSGSDIDKEANSANPWDISTAYIRNAPMKSPWELGFIHRAKAFQTLNLKEYNADQGFARKSNGTYPGGDDYSENSDAGLDDGGDAIILDQIKMTSNPTTQGMINVNSDNSSVLRTLFDKIQIGSPKVDPGLPGTGEISVAEAESLSSIIFSKNGTSGGAPFYTRAQIVNDVPGLSNGTYGTQDNDAKQEELIGKFINLTKAEASNEYTVIAVGQAIKDVNGVPKSDGTTSSYGVYETGIDQILSSQKILAIIKKRIDSDGTVSFYIQDMMYLDQ